MKLFIHFHQSFQKKSSLLKSDDLIRIEAVFLALLKKVPQLKKVKEIHVNLTLCSKQKIKALNAEYRNKNKVTDVLSFPLFEELRPDKLGEIVSMPVIELGDIFICKDVAISQAKEFKISFEMEVYHQLVHGFLHLLGFDHEISIQEEKIMEKYENQLVKSIYKKLGFEK